MAWDVTLSIPPELKEGEPFIYKIDSDISCNIHVVGDMASRYNQYYKLIEVRASIEAMRELPCNVSIRIKASDGLARITSDISAVDSESQNLAEGGLAAVPRDIDRFVRAHTKSSFSLSYSQTVRIDLYKGSAEAAFLKHHLEANLWDIITTAKVLQMEEGDLNTKIKEYGLGRQN